MPLPFDLDVGAHLAEPLALLVLVVRGIEQEVERRLEPVGDLDRVRHDGQVRRDQGEHRRDVVAGAGDEAVGRSDYPDLRRLYCQFFMRLAKRSFDRVLARIELAAREGNLPGVRAHTLRAVGEEHAGPGHFQPRGASTKPKRP